MPLTLTCEKIVGRVRVLRKMRKPPEMDLYSVKITQISSSENYFKIQKNLGKGGWRPPL